MSDYETVLFDLADGVATITLNRPEVLNAFNQQMLDEFSDIWKRCRVDEDVRVIVLRAAGGRAFSTGVDRKAGRTRHPNPWSADDPGFFLGAKQNRVWKPLLCAVNGMCAGGAFYWINEADVVIWAPGLVHPDCLREHANPSAQLIDCSRLSQEEVVEYYRKAASDRLKVAKLHAADSVLWGAVVIWRSTSVHN